MKHHKNIKESSLRNEERTRRYGHLRNLREFSMGHPMFTIAQQEVDRLFDSSHYEHGGVVGISTTRERFDDLHENYRELYRGGFEEIQVGGHYVIYGFNFD